MNTLEKINKKNGILTGLKSFCGALPSPESSNNEIGYKPSWYPLGMLMAAKNPAFFLCDGKEKYIPGESLLFYGKSNLKNFLFKGFAFEMIPNRDSISYIDYYGMDKKNLKNMLRGTLRYSGFLSIFRSISTLGLLKNENDENSIQFKIEKDLSWKKIISQLIGLKKSDNSEENLMKVLFDFLKKNYEKQKEFINFDIEKDLLYSIQSLKSLGFLDDFPFYDILPSFKSFEGKKLAPIYILGEYLTEKIKYSKGERDMIYMHHEFDVEYSEKEKKRKEKIISTIIELGSVNGFSATSKLVAIPVSIAIDLFLSGKLDKLKGVFRPTHPTIYKNILKELEKEGVFVKEKILIE